MTTPLDSLGLNPTTEQLYNVMAPHVPAWVLLAMEYVDSNAYERGRSGLRAEFDQPGGVSLNGMTVHAIGTDTIEVLTYRAIPRVATGDQSVSITAEPFS